MTSRQRVPDDVRYADMSVFEQKASSAGYLRVAGVDEAGRGPLAGPVVAAACILSPDRPILWVNDSKKLSAARREALYQTIVRECVSYCVAFVEPEEIDRINILQATIQAMRLAVAGLDQTPDLLLIDAIQLSGMAMQIGRAHV